MNHAELPDQSKKNMPSLTGLGGTIAGDVGPAWGDCFSAVTQGKLQPPFGPSREMTLEDTMRLQPIIHLVGLCIDGQCQFWSDLVQQPDKFKDKYMPCSAEDEFAMILKVFPLPLKPQASMPGCPETPTPTPLLRRSC